MSRLKIRDRHSGLTEEERREGEVEVWSVSRTGEVVEVEGKLFFFLFCLLPDSGALQCLLPDAVQLDAADVMVADQTASAPAHDHRGLEEIRPALLQPALLPEAVAHRQLPGHVQVPSEKQDTKVK